MDTQWCFRMHPPFSFQKSTPNSLSVPSTQGIPIQTIPPRLCSSELKETPTILGPHQTTSDPHISGASFLNVVSDQQLKHSKRMYLILTSSQVDLEALGAQCWLGCSPVNRSLAWRLLLGVTPTQPSEREAAAERLTHRYESLLARFPAALAMYNNDPLHPASLLPGSYIEGAEDEPARLSLYKAMIHQIVIDAPRTGVDICLFGNIIGQALLTRVYFAWCLEQTVPEDAYIQGILDLAIPIVGALMAGLQPAVDICNIDFESEEQVELLKSNIKVIEPQLFGCVSTLMFHLRHMYSPGQPQMHTEMDFMMRLLSRHDPDLSAHLTANQIIPAQFSVRWFSTAFLRELSPLLGPRLFDVLLVEGEHMTRFLAYIATSVVVHFREPILERSDFSDLITFLQRLPTTSWSLEDLEPVLSLAFVLRRQYDSAQGHLEDRVIE